MTCYIRKQNMFQIPQIRLFETQMNYVFSKFSGKIKQYQERFRNYRYFCAQDASVLLDFNNRGKLRFTSKKLGSDLQ